MNVGGMAVSYTHLAYLPVYLVQKKVVKKAYAADVRKGPLLHAKEHIEQYGLGEYIQTRLSDGGESFVPGESEVAVIAGMGGGLMQKILSGSPEFFEKNSCVVLQLSLIHIFHGSRRYGKSCKYYQSRKGCRLWSKRKRKRSREKV